MGRLTVDGHAKSAKTQPNRACLDDVSVIVTCLKKRHSGVSATISALLPHQAKQISIGYVGPDLPGVEQAKREAAASFQPLTLRQAIALSRRRLPDGRPRIWHVRRDIEMMLGIFLRDVLRFPIRLVFTSAAIRQHSAGLRWLIGRMDRVIATSPAAAAFFRNSEVVGHGVDVNQFSPPTTPRDDVDVGDLPKGRVIGVFGRVREEKGIHVFVRALIPLLPKFPDVTAAIVGLTQPDDKAFADELRQEIETAGLTKRFKWVGEVSPEHMPEWYRRVSITVCCPLYEGYGLTGIEAMASGCALLASRTGAFAQMVDEGKTGFIVEPGDTAGLSSAMNTLLDNPASCEAMGRAGRERAGQHFTIAAEAEGIERVYEDIWGETNQSVP